MVIDMHGESPWGKALFATALDGMVAALVGTHTHDPTLRGHILPGGPGNVTELGMTGSLWFTGGGFDPVHFAAQLRTYVRRKFVEPNSSRSCLERRILRFGSSSITANVSESLTGRRSGSAHDQRGLENDVGGSGGSFDEHVHREIDGVERHVVCVLMDGREVDARVL